MSALASRLNTMAAEREKEREEKLKDAQALLKEVDTLQDLLTAKNSEIARLKHKLASSWRQEMDQQIHASQAKGTTERVVQQRAARDNSASSEDDSDDEEEKEERQSPANAPNSTTSLSAVHTALLREVMNADRVSSHSKAELEGILRSRAFALALVRKMTHSFAPSVLSRFLIRHQPDFSKLYSSVERQLEKEVQLVFLGTQNFKVTAAMRITSARACALVIASHHVRSPPVAPLPPPVAADAKDEESVNIVSQTRIPVYYVPKGSPVCPWLLDFAASHFCAVREVPIRVTRSGPEGLPSVGMDLAVLSSMLESDAASSTVVPCAVFAFLGVPSGADVSELQYVYHMDDLWNIRKVCTVMGVWLHVEGSLIPFAAARSTPPFGLALSACADSFCLEPERVELDTTLLFLRHTASAHHAMDATNVASPRVFQPKLPAKLPVLVPVRAAVVTAWMYYVRQKVGFITEAADNQLELALNFKRLLKDYKFIQDLSPPPSMHPHVTAFQAVLDGTDPRALNDWLDRAITRPVMEELGIKRNEEGHFVFEVSVASRPSQIAARLPALKTTLGNMERHLRWLGKAMQVRNIFEQRLASKEDLEYVAAESIDGGVIGLGAFRFLPAFSIPLEHKGAFSTHLAEELSHRRANVYERATTKHGTPCIVVHADASFERKQMQAVDDIVKEILEVARKLKLPQEVEEDLEKVVSKGIKDAERKLQEKLDNAYSASALTDSLLRSVPLVGSVYGWLLPSGNTAVDDPSSQSFDIRSQMLTAPTVKKSASSPTLPTTTSALAAAQAVDATVAADGAEEKAVADAARTRNPPPPPGPPPAHAMRSQATQMPTPAKAPPQEEQTQKNGDEEEEEDEEEEDDDEEYTDEEDEVTGSEEYDDDDEEEEEEEEEDTEESDGSLPRSQHRAHNDNAPQHQSQAKSPVKAPKSAKCSTCRDTGTIFVNRVLSSGMHQKVRASCPACRSIDALNRAAVAFQKSSLRNPSDMKVRVIQ